MNFNWKFYVNYYKDLKDAGIDSHEEAWEHWVNFGEQEGRICYETIDNFDWEYYINYYQDLKDAGIDTEEEAWEHWVNYGKQEGRNYYPIRPFINEKI